MTEVNVPTVALLQMSEPTPTELEALSHPLSGRQDAKELRVSIGEGLASPNGPLDLRSPVVPRCEVYEEGRYHL